MEHASSAMANLVSKLLMARNTAHVHHWKVKSFAAHLALGELYDSLSEMADELMEMYMGRYGTGDKIEISDPNGFDESDYVGFVRQLDDFLKDQEKQIPQDGFLVNKFQELQGAVSRIRYKIENLH